MTYSSHVPDTSKLLATEEAIEPYRWVIAALLGVGVLVNYFDRVNLSVSHEALVATFAISPVVFGNLSAAYSWTYAACQLPTGVILDRFGVRRVTIWSVLIWGIASLAAAISPGIIFFFAARLLLGIGEAPTFPANAKAVGRWFPRSERSLATALYDSSAKLANGIGVPILGFLILRIGWRLSFGVTALLSVAYLALFAFLYREPQRQSLRDQPIPEFATEAAPIPLARLLREKKIIGLSIGFGAYNYVFYLLLTWLPTYFVEQLHLPPMRSFLLTGAPWLIAAASELLIGGVVTDSLIQRGWNPDRVRRTVLIGGTTLGLALFFTLHPASVLGAVIPITIANSGLAIASTVGWSLPAMLVPNSSTGKVGGIVNFSNQISAILAPIITGFVVKYTHSFAWAFGIAGGYLVLGILAYIFLLGRIEPIGIHSVGGEQ